MTLHWSWDHFFTDGSFYKQNRFNKTAWCKQCLAYHYALLRDADTLAMAMTGLAQARTPTQLHDSGMSSDFIKAKRRSEIAG